MTRLRSSFNPDRFVVINKIRRPRVPAKRHYYAQYSGNTASVRWGNGHIKLERSFESEVTGALARDGRFEVDLASGAHYVIDIATNMVLSVSGRPDIRLDAVSGAEVSAA